MFVVFSDDKNLPSVPPLQLSVPADYPDQSPYWADDGDQYGETHLRTRTSATAASLLLLTDFRPAYTCFNRPECDEVDLFQLINSFSSWRDVRQRSDRLVFDRRVSDDNDLLVIYRSVTFCFRFNQ